MTKRLYIMHFILFVFIIHHSLTAYAQHSFNATGNDVSSSTGKVAYSIGQVFYNVAGDTSIQIQEGVQQAYSISNVSTDQLRNAIELKCFPNPTSNRLLLEIIEDECLTLSYELIDVKGLVCYTDKINHTITEINMSGYASGVYFLKVSSVEKKRHSTFKILKH